VRDRKSQITRAALAVFTAYGLRRTSMEDVAAEAGLSRPAIYQYFRNKDDLIAACFDLVTEDGFALAEAAQEGITPPTARVSAFLTTYLCYYHRLVVSGPHSDEVLEVETRFGPSKVKDVREKLVKRLNTLAGLEEDDETGIILAHAGQGLKMLAPDEATLTRRLERMVTALLARTPTSNNM